MERNLKVRTLGLLLLVGLCVATLLPTFVPAQTLPSWFRTAFSSSINLGLDLQGGLRIVYGIDLAKAIDDKAFELKRDIDTRLVNDKITGTVSTPASPLGAVGVKVDDAKRAEVAAIIKADYGDVVTERSCNADEPAGSICVKVSSAYAEGVRRAALRNAVNTIRERIDERGVAESTVVEKGDDIIVELPGLETERIQNVKDIIARTAKLEFKLVLDGDPWMRSLWAKVGFVPRGDDKGKAKDPAAAAVGIRAEEDTWAPPGGGASRTEHFLMAQDREELVSVEEARRDECYDVRRVQPDGRVLCKRTGRFVIERYVAQLAAEDPKFKIQDDRAIAFEYVERGWPADGGSFWRTHFVDRAVRLSGAAISDAVTSYDPNTFRPVVNVTFNRYGGRVFGDLTAQNVGRKFATILDDKVKSAPVINQAIRGGTAQISMGGGDGDVQQQEANDLVAVLKTGSLPAPLREESASKVGPSLGRDAVDKAWFAFSLGIVLVVLVMTWFYRASGAIALVTLTLNVLFQLTALVLIDATLTLPGIAGIVLTFGMSVDGNIIIFERIREELAKGKSVRGAVDTGFSRAFGAILDGQLTTMAGGLVLYAYGSGPITGFAVTLIIGNITALLANIWCTRVLYDHYLNFVRRGNRALSI